MPIYEYECPTCEKVTETERKLDERDNVIICDICGELLNRITFPRTVTHIYKGTGFYTTDYKKDN